MLRLFYFLLLFFTSVTLCQAQYTVSDLPSPKEQGQDYFVSNPDGILSSFAVDSLNRISIAIEEVTTAEVAVVIINDFVGEDDFEFALEIFNSWGIGKEANNNGLLLLVSKERRTYRFISGYGIEGLLPDAILKRVGENYLVPHFKEGDYESGMLAAMNVIREALISPEGTAELIASLQDQPFYVRYQYSLIYSLLVIVFTFAMLRWITYLVEEKVLAGKSKVDFNKPFLPAFSGCGCMCFFVLAGVFVLWVLGGEPKDLIDIELIPWYLAIGGSLAISVKYSQGEEFIIKSFRDEKNRLDKLAEYHRLMLLPLVLSPLSFFSVMGYTKRKRKMRERFLPPDKKGEWVRFDRDVLKKKTNYLNKGQLKEEQELSRSYEIWKEKNTGDIQVVAWEGLRGKNFSACPECGFLTFAKPTVKTIEAATYKASGRGEKQQKCVNCMHVLSLGEVVIARKVKNSSSGSGGGYSRSSGGGSFGGGSSGGGGAGGGW